MRISDYLDPALGLLDEDFPLPLDQPFTRRHAEDAGLHPRDLAALVSGGQLRRVVRGVFAASQAPDTVLFRARALGLVVPEHAIVTDRTAAWLHGVPILQRGAHLTAPPVTVCHTVDSRVRRPEVDGHRRQLLARDIVVHEGVRVTTPLRTACDLGRLLWRFDAFAALDGFLRIGLSHDELLQEVGRFRGFRGIRQLRAFAPLADPRSESPGESALRLHWLDAGLPKPELQIWVPDETGLDRYRLDLGLEGLRYAAEYDGEQFHSSEEDRAHDEERRAWLREERGWTIDAFTKEPVYAMRSPVPDVLRAGFLAAKKSVSIWVP